MKLPTYVSFTPASSSSLTFSFLILFISLIISTTELSVTSFLTLAEAEKLDIYLLVDALE